MTPAPHITAYLAEINARLGGAWAIKLAQEMSRSPRYCDPVRGPFIAEVGEIVNPVAKSESSGKERLETFVQGRIW